MNSMQHEVCWLEAMMDRASGLLQQDTGVYEIQAKDKDGLKAQWILLVASLAR